MEKIRPIAKEEYDCGMDGRDGYYFIAYYCPSCHKRIVRGYNSDTACDKCGTFFDWGNHKPKVETVRKIVWD